MSSDEEDFVFYGTPIEREEEISTRKKKAVAEASGQLRTALPPWKQEVTDEDGRRRFHGAFTGGFSAGYFNTVGSKEGWAPQSFTSSRKSRAEVKQQSIYNFLDEDEKAELEGRSLGASTQFDTFGFTAAELARKQAEKEQKQRPSAIPGPVPDELVVPVTESIGVKLLIKMGWRQGRSIKDSNRNNLSDARREARKAFLALSSEKGSSQPADPRRYEEDDDNIPNDDQLSRKTPAYVLNPKQDLYGLGYDPFRQAPEFREKKRQRLSGGSEMGLNRFHQLKGKIGPGFGIGALEDLDAEDEDIYASGYELQDTYVQEIEEPSRANVDSLRITDGKKNDILPGFKAATNSDSQFERFEPPEIPKDFVPHHKFPAPLGNDAKSFEVPPPEVPPPEDDSLKVLIEGVAALVARCGKLFEDLSREKNQTNPLFGFLSGGNGSDFYVRKLWEECQKRGQQTKLWDSKMPQISENMNSERRGKILGEKALGRSLGDSSSLVASAAAVNVQFQLSDTFTKPTSVADSTKPFLDDPAKQKRFEQFLKEKYHGGLRTKDSGGSSDMSEAARARERLEFEAAAEALEKENSANVGKAGRQLLADSSSDAGLKFTTQKNKTQEELMTKAMYPRREEYQWRPAPILCTRFDLIDPYMGKPPPAPRVRSKMDSFIFLPDSIKTSDVKKPSASEASASVAPQMDSTKQDAVETKVEVEHVERPVDLYKAIFSDGSDDEEKPTLNQVDDTQKKTEAAHSTLNRLIADDFLESLGIELGLMVPPDLPGPENKVSGKEVINMDKSTVDGSQGKPLINVHQEGRNLHRKHNHSETSSSSEDRRKRKNSVNHRHKSRSSASDVSGDSDDYRDRSRSRSRRKDEASREKSGSRNHSRHHKHRKDSPHRSHRSSGKDFDRKRKKHKYDY